MAQTASSERRSLLDMFSVPPEYENMSADQIAALISSIQAQDEHDKACGRESAIVRFVRAQLSTSPPEDHASAQQETS